MARLLAVVLHEVKASDELFAKALAAASDDEQKALVRWHQADSMRDREDLPDNAAFDELDKLAHDLPRTYWGSVAKDVLRATRLKVGDDAIAFTTKTRAGASFSLAEQTGKVVVLVFWSSADPDVGNLVTMLRELERRFGDKLAVLGICCDPDPAAIDGTAQKLGIDFPVAGDGKGFQNDVALRWFVSAPVVQVIDKHGKVAALGQHAGTRDARTELQEAVAAAVQRD
jgi:peroxiredoxin